MTIWRFSNIMEKQQEVIKFIVEQGIKCKAYSFSENIKSRIKWKLELKDHGKDVHGGIVNSPFWSIQEGSH